MAGGPQFQARGGSGITRNSTSASATTVILREFATMAQ
jgi:hypothetical protein